MNNKRIALITGAGRGIGREIALGLAEDGFTTILVSRTSSELEDTASLINKVSPHRPKLVALDVADDEKVSALVAQISSEYGKIDLLVNNAAINHRGTLDLSYQQFDDMTRVNLRGAFCVLKEVVPGMKSRKAGQIINISSICGKVGFAGSGAYCATKFALLGLNESLFNELMPLGIKVTALCPSWVNTTMASYSPHEPQAMIPTKDILNTLRYLINLSPTSCVKEIVVDCASDYR